METLQEIKNTYAQEQGYEDWKELREELYGNVPELRIEKYMDEICIRAQKEALEKASENAKTKTVTVQGQDEYIHDDEVVDYTSITNPENLIR